MTTDTPNANGAASASGGSKAGTADFDALLREYTDGAKPAQPAPDVLAQFKPVIDFAKTEMDRRQTEALTKDLSEAIKFVKEEETLKEMPDKLVRGMLEAYALDDESFVQAFQNRGKDQNAWKAKLAQARTAVGTEFKGIAQPNRVSSDVLAARAAVAGAVVPSTREGQPLPDEMMKMSDRDFDALIAKELARKL